PNRAGDGRGGPSRRGEGTGAAGRGIATTRGPADGCRPRRAALVAPPGGGGPARARVAHRRGRAGGGPLPGAAPPAVGTRAATAVAGVGDAPFGRMTKEGQGPKRQGESPHASPRPLPSFPRSAWERPVPRRSGVATPSVSVAVAPGGPRRGSVAGSAFPRRAREREWGRSPLGHWRVRTWSFFRHWGAWAFVIPGPARTARVQRA